MLADVPNDLIEYGASIDRYLPPSLRQSPELMKRAVIIRKLDMLPVECIVRAFLTGSGWKDYQQTGMVCGIKLPAGLHDGFRLPKPIFTPSTKAQEGHDENIDAEEVLRQHGGEVIDLSSAVFERCANYTAANGIYLADSKFELGWSWSGGLKVLCLGDEVVTPDSSRFWDRRDYELSAARLMAPAGYDKEPVRKYFKSVQTTFDVTMDQLKPEAPEHLEFVDNHPFPEDVIMGTAVRYSTIFNRLVHKELEEFWVEDMGIVA